jgi:hypothetical protein
VGSETTPVYMLITKECFDQNETDFFAGRIAKGWNSLAKKWKLWLFNSVSLLKRKQLRSALSDKELQKAFGFFILGLTTLLSLLVLKQNGG